MLASFSSPGALWSPLQAGVTLAVARPPTRNRRPLCAIAVAALLANCGGGNDHGICYSCGVTPAEIPRGVASADFNDDGALAVLFNGKASPGASPVAIADVAGDGKPDIVVGDGVTGPLQGGAS